MELRFHPHAVDRMQERKVSVADVELIINSSDGRINQSRDKAILYKKFSKRKDNLIAAVIVEKINEDLIEVVTILINFEVRK